MIELFLALSILLNIFFVVYCRWLINILKAREEDVNKLADNIAEYIGHVKSVHEMEMFYGDQALMSLVTHGSSLISTIEEFDFLLSDNLEIEGESED